MGSSLFAAIPDWKSFERLCADLLEAERYRIVSEPFLDRSGTDILAEQEYRSHAGDSLNIEWRVQCKHYATSGARLGKNDVEQILYHYEARRESGQGLLLITDTDYTEEAKHAVDDYLKNHPSARIELWNQRQLLSRLQRHPNILARYGIQPTRVDVFSTFLPLRSLAPISTLVISDQSALAHDLTSVLRRLTYEVSFFPFWNYQDAVKTDLICSAFPDRFDLVIVFLGDSFTLRMPDEVVELMRKTYATGGALLLFPFLAWSLRRGMYSWISDIVPVRLEDPSRGEKLSLQRVTGEYKRGDFRWLLSPESFAEDRYMELDPRDGHSPFIEGIDKRFGLSHSFEYLRVVDGAKAAWKDTTGNPVVVVDDVGTGKVCYLNTCCHSCMTSVPVSSPLEASRHFGSLLRNILSWLLR